MKMLVITLASALMLSIAPAETPQDDGAVTLLTTQKLENLPGNSLTAVVVTYPPGGKTPKHHHTGSVFAYILSGSIRSQNSATGPARTYNAGDTFFEPAGSEHLVSANASDTRGASLLVVAIAPDGATPTTYDK